MYPICITYLSTLFLYICKMNYDIFDAIDRHDLKRLRYLLARVKDLNYSCNIHNQDTYWAHGSRSFTPLERACAANFAKGVVLLLERNAHINHISKNKDTPLLVAIKKGHLHMVRLLCTHAVDVNLSDDKHSPLHVAVYYNHLEICKELVAHKANIYAVDNIGGMPFHYTIRPDRRALMEFFLSLDRKFVNKLSYDENYAIHNVIDHYQDLDLLRLCLRSGSDVDQRGWFGSTPLHHACYFLHAYIYIPILLAHGADINATFETCYGVSTPLHHLWEEKLSSGSAWETHLGLLLSNGANPCIGYFRKTHLWSRFGTIQDIQRKYRANWTMQFLLACARKQTRVLPSSILSLPVDLLRSLHTFLR